VDVTMAYLDEITKVPTDRKRRKRNKRGTFAGRPQGALCTKPRNPSLVLEIIYLRERVGLPWRDIGERLGLSHQAPYLVYKRWRPCYSEWA